MLFHCSHKISMSRKIKRTFYTLNQIKAMSAQERDKLQNTMNERLEMEKKEEEELRKADLKKRKGKYSVYYINILFTRHNTHLYFVFLKIHHHQMKM